MKPQRIDYRRLRWNNLCSPEFQHLKLLLYWPVFGLLFLCVERIWTNRTYLPVHCALDDAIPFCEFFLIPYLFWFVYLVGIHLYTLLFDVKSFEKLMRFIMVTYSIAMVLYLIFPTQQNLRPETFERHNLFTQFMTYFYQFDTNTNVCPSIHVIGSVAVFLAAWNSPGLRTPGWRIASGVTAGLICISTVFLKQHSVLDIAAAVPVCLIGYLLVYRSKAAQTNPRRNAVLGGDLK